MNKLIFERAKEINISNFSAIEMFKLQWNKQNIILTNKEN